MSTFDPVRSEAVDRSFDSAPVPPAGTPVARPAAPPEPVEPDFLNLARRPFLNSRPVVRAALLLWGLGGLLLLVNAMLFWGYLSDSKEKRTELASLEREIEAERTDAGQLASKIAGSDLRKHNGQILYLNSQIAGRTFSWSRLFDRIAEIQPKDVRLNRLTPAGVTAKDAARRPELLMDESGRVTLNILGEAKTDEAMMEFVESLFAHPSFDNPDIPRETREEEGGLVKFELKVDYLPGAAAIVEEPVPDVSIVEEPAAPTASAPSPGASRP